MSETTERRPQAELNHLALALEAIENAQLLLADAARELSNVTRVDKESNAVLDAHNQIKETWDLVSNVR